MPSRTRTFTLSIASMAAVMSLVLSTPDATAAPSDQEPGVPSTSVQTTSPGTDPLPTTTQTETASADPSAPSSDAPATTTETAPSTSVAPTASSEVPTPSASTPPATKPQARAAVAAGCQTYPPTSYQVCGRIRDKYNQLNGPNGYLLFPKSNELTNPGNTGKRSEFLGGNIYWSTATDAHPVAHDFLTKWGQYGYEGGFMKYPVTDEIPLGGADGRRQEFQGAYMYYSIPTGTHNVQGAILDKYKAMGAQGSYLGYPTSDEVVTPDGKGRFNFFQNGTIYWSPTTGAHPVTGIVLGIWGDDGFESGKYGYPTADPVFGTANLVDISQTFQRNKIDVNLLGETPVYDLGNPDPSFICNIYPFTDNPHVTNGDASVHAGYQVDGDCPSDLKGDVLVTLQSTLGDSGDFRDRSLPGVQTGVGPNGTLGDRQKLPSGNRANARYTCQSSEKNYWRGIVKVNFPQYGTEVGPEPGRVAVLEC